MAAEYTNSLALPLYKHTDLNSLRFTVYQNTVGVSTEFISDD